MGQYRTFIYISISLLLSGQYTFSQELSLTPEELQFIKEHPIIRLGGERDWEPMILIENGKVQGFDRDMLNEIETLTGLEFKIEAGNWNEIVEKAKNKEIDGLLYSSDQPERRKYFLFTDPYIFYQAGLYSNLNQSVITRLSELEGSVVGVQATDQFSNNFIDSISCCIKKTYPNRESVIQAVLSGEVQYYFGALDLDYYLAKNAITGVKLVYLVPNEQFEAVYSIRNDYALLVSIMNKAIAAIPEVKVNEIMTKWGFGRRSSVILEKKLINQVVLISIIAVSFILLWVYSLHRQIKKRKKAQFLMSEYKANLLALIENSAGLIYSLDPEMKVVIKNKNFERFIKLISGKSIKIGDNFADFIPKPYKALWMERYGQGFSGERYSVQDTSDITGETRSFMTSFNPIKMNGQITGLACFTEDITEYTALNRYMISMMESSYDYLFVKDTNYRYIVASQSMANVNGFESWKDFIGKTDHELNPVNAAEFQEDERKVIEEGLISINKEHRFKDKDGKERWVESTNEPIYNAEGSIIGLSGVSRDITEAKKANRTNSMLLSAVESSGDFITFFDDDLKFIYLNRSASKIIGAKQGDSIEKFLQPGLIQKIKDGLINMEDPDSKIRDELEIIDKSDGKIRIVDSVAVKIFDEEDNFICYANIARDVTERNALQQELTDSKIKDELMNATMQAEDQERTRIASELHDGVQQKLVATSMSMQMIEDPLISKSLELINESITELRRVSHSLSPRTLDSMGLAAAIEDNITMLNNVQPVHFKFFSNMEGERLKRLIELNLFRIVQEAISNIMKHAQASEVFIQLIKTKDQLNLSIEDDGIGFDLQDTKNGLGLAGIRNRVETIGGHLHIDSQLEKSTNLLIELVL